MNQSYEIIVKGVIEKILNCKLESDLLSELEDGVVFAFDWKCYS